MVPRVRLASLLHAGGRDVVKFDILGEALLGVVMQDDEGDRDAANTVQWPQAIGKHQERLRPGLIPALDSSSTDRRG